MMMGMTMGAGGWRTALSETRYLSNVRQSLGRQSAAVRNKWKQNAAKVMLHTICLRTNNGSFRYIYACITQRKTLLDSWTTKQHMTYKHLPFSKLSRVHTQTHEHAWKPQHSDVTLSARTRHVAPNADRRSVSDTHDLWFDGRLPIQTASPRGHRRSAARPLR